MGEATRDAFGHVTSKRFPNGSLGGVIERAGSLDCKTLLVLSEDGDPARGYDRVYWYESVERAINALDAWDYPTMPKPVGYIRDLQADPIRDW